MSGNSVALNLHYSHGGAGAGGFPGAEAGPGLGAGAQQIFGVRQSGQWRQVCTQLGGVAAAVAAGMSRVQWAPWTQSAKQHQVRRSRRGCALPVRALPVRVLQL